MICAALVTVEVVRLAYNREVAEEEELEDTNDEEDEDAEDECTGIESIDELRYPFGRLRDN